MERFFIRLNAEDSWEIATESPRTWKGVDSLGQCVSTESPRTWKRVPELDEWSWELCERVKRDGIEEEVILASFYDGSEQASPLAEMLVKLLNKEGS